MIEVNSQILFCYVASVMNCGDSRILQFIVKKQFTIEVKLKLFN